MSVIYSHLLRNRFDVLRPKTRALAALIKYGDSAPPAPNEFMAFHNPGAMKPTPPMMKALKSVVRYQMRFVPRIDPSLDDTSVGFKSAMLFARTFNPRGLDRGLTWLFITKS